MGFWHGLYGIELYDKYNEWKCPEQFQYFEFNYKDIDENCWSVFTNFTTLTDQVNVYDIYGICYETTENPQYSYDIFATSDIGFAKVGNELKKYKKVATSA